MKEPTGKMGFPPGVAKKLVLNAYKRYEEMALEMTKKQEEIVKRKTAEKMVVTPTPPVALQEEVTTVEAAEPHSNDEATHPGPANTECPTAEPDTQTPLQQQKESVSDTVKMKTSTEQPDEATTQPDEETPTTDRMEEEAPVETGPMAAAAGGGDQAEVAKDNSTEDEELTRQQKAFQENPESYNGAIRDNYAWSQSITDLDVHIKVPPSVTRGKDVRVELRRKHLLCRYVDSEGTWHTLVDEDLTWDINREESMWSLVPGEHVHVNLEKVEERWWEAVVISEPHISVRKIDPSRPITDLDGAAQSKIEEMMYNEQQKRMGLPQSHEKKTHDILRSAWNAEGSPFKGQAFDPSKINVSPSDGSMVNFPQP